MALHQRGEGTFIAVGDEALQEVDFSGGTARILTVERGTDAFRRLAEYGDRRKLTLVIEAQDGTRLNLDLVQFGPR